MRKIVRCQIWICGLLDALISLNIKHFGKEGLGTKQETIIYARPSQKTIQEIGQEIQSRGREKMIQKAGRKWLRALKKSDAYDVRIYMQQLDAITILQAQDSSTHMFSLEDHTQHGSIVEIIQNLTKQAEHLRSTQHYQRAIEKKGKNLSQEELVHLKQYNEIVQKHNKLLKHKGRDDAIFSSILKHQQASNDVTIFVLGQAHKKAQIKRAKKNLPESTLFVWITPPNLWLWEASVKAFWIILAIGFIAFLLSFQL